MSRVASLLAVRESVLFIQPPSANTDLTDLRMLLGFNFSLLTFLQILVFDESEYLLYIRISCYFTCH